MSIGLPRLPGSAFVLALVALFGGLSTAGFAPAQGYPNKPLRLIIPYPAGGASDLTARAVVSVADEYLGQPMIVVIRSGGGGAVGAEAAARSKPDGYTLFMADPANLIILPQVQKIGYNPADFVPVGQVASLPALLMVQAGAPWKTAKDFIGAARKEPGKLKHSAVTFSPEHLMFEAMAATYGAKLTHIPSTGGGPALASLLGGHVDANGLYPPVAYPHIQGGKLRALGLASSKRWPLLPDVPTLAEQGFESIEVYAWFGLMAPARTPPDIVPRWQSELAKVARVPAVATRLNELGFEVVMNSPEEFKTLLLAEHNKWAQLIKTAKISLQ